MKPKSAKEKGNRYEKHLIEVFRENLDEKSRRSYGSGAGLDKNDLNLPAYDIEVEAKNQMKINLLDWWEQTKNQERMSGRTSVLILRNPRLPEFQESLVVMDLYAWLELLKSTKEETTVINNKDPKLKYKISRLKQAINDVMKDL